MYHLIINIYMADGAVLFVRNPGVGPKHWHREEREREREIDIEAWELMCDKFSCH